MAARNPRSWKRRLQEVRAAGQERVLSRPSGVDFSSNDYLGYAHDPIESSPSLADDAPVGRGATAARLLRGNHPIWEQVEAALAGWHECQATLVMPSGYVANEGLLATVIESDDWVASDQWNHASIVDGLRLSRAEKFVYAHRDLDQLESGLRAASANRQRGTRWVVTESLFGMDGTLAPLAEIVALAERFGASVLVDEAHATGCFGPQGQGLVEHLQLRSRVAASVHTGGKALAVCGAYICGSDLLKRLLVNCCRHFMFTTALPPLLGVWWCDVLQRVRVDHPRRDRLHAAARQLRSQLAAWDHLLLGDGYIVPVVLGPEGKAMQVAVALQQLGWDIRAIRPPSVPHMTARLRISLHANHQPQQLNRLAEDLGRILHEEAEG